MVSKAKPGQIAKGGGGFLSLKSALVPVRCPLSSSCLWSFIVQGSSKESLKNLRHFLSGVQQTCGSVMDSLPSALFRAMKFMSSVLYTVGLNESPQVHATGHSDGKWSPPRVPQGHVVCPSLYPQTLSFLKLPSWPLASLPLLYMLPADQALANEPTKLFNGFGR